MTVLARAPFLLVLTGLVVTLALTDRTDARALTPVALLVVCGILLLSFHTAREGEGRIAALTLVLLFLSALWVIRGVTREPSVPFFVRTTGTVADVRPWGRFYAVSVKTPEGGFLLKLPFAELAEGMRVSLEGSVKAFRGETSKSGFREDRFWYARGLSAQLTGVSFDILPGPSRGIHSWRYGLYRALVLHTPRLTGSTLNAAWTGKRDAALNERHRTWGTSHILAVSGFHVGIVVLCAVRARGLFRLFFAGGKSGKRYIFQTSLILWLYVLLTGASPGAVRAALMVQTALLGRMAGRPGSTVNSVSLAATLLLLYSPFLFWDIGWRLSVMAALVIAALTAREASLTRCGVWGGRMCRFFIGPAVWLTTFPQVSWTFGGVPVVGLLINFFAPAFFGLGFILGSFVAALRLAGIPGADFLLGLVDATFILWSAAADRAALVFPWQVEWSSWFACGCAALFIALLCRALSIPCRNAVLLAFAGSVASFLLFCPA